MPSCGLTSTLISPQFNLSYCNSFREVYEVKQIIYCHYKMDYSREKRPRSDSHERRDSAGRGRYFESNVYGGRGDGRDGRYSQSGGRGRGGRGDGGRGRGIRHIGEIQQVKDLLHSPELRNDSLMRVILPPKENVMNRQSLMVPGRPSPAEWRYSDSVGVNLNSRTACIRVNAFGIRLDTLPEIIYQYRVEIRKIIRKDLIEEVDEEDITERRKNELMSITVIDALLKDLRKNPANGIAYDGSHSIFSVDDLNLTPQIVAVDSTSRVESLSDESASSDGLEFTYVTKIPTGSRFTVKIRSLGPFRRPVWPIPSDNGEQMQLWNNYVRMLDIALHSFARWQLIKSSQDWFVDKTNIFRSEGSDFLENNPILIALKGYSSSLKICRAGLILQTDLSVSIFLKGGPIIEILQALGGFSSLYDMESAANKSKGLKDGLIREIYEKLKKVRVKIIHMNHNKTLKGVLKSSIDAKFDMKGTEINVDDYYRKLCDDGMERVLRHLPDRRLKYPYFPVIDVGSKAKPIYYPVELVHVIPGQPRPVDPQVQAQVVRIAAVPAEERYKYITDTTDGLPKVIKDEDLCDSFGLANIEDKPMRVGAKLLPPAKLLYSKGKETVDPGLSGAWLTHDRKFFLPAGYNLQNLNFSDRDPSPIKYGILAVGSNRNHLENKMYDFASLLEKEGENMGLFIRQGGPVMHSSTDESEIFGKMDRLQQHGCVFLLVIMCAEAYASIKLMSADAHIPTQVITWARVDRTPKGIYLNVLLKINAKIGGINHVLASRMSIPPPDNHITPIPGSISWIFDKECTMVMGMDFSEKSYMGVVASMDAHAARYASFLASPAKENDCGPQLMEATEYLLRCFEVQNRMLPRNILIFRDGVSDSEFNQINNEVDSVKRAYNIVAKDTGRNMPPVRVMAIMCQKRHRIRFFYEDFGNPSDIKYHNPCPGVVVDGTILSDLSINSDEYIEFYLNSHSPIQGTCKPCRYIVLHDDIGLQVRK